MIHKAQGQEIIDGFLVGNTFNGVLQDALDLGGKDKAFFILAKIEGLYTEPVTREEENPFIFIVNDKGPHAIEPFDTFRSPLFVGMEDHLAVCLRAEGMAGAEEILPEFTVVVDLPIEDEPEGFVLIGHGLGGQIREVDDGEAAVGKADRTSEVGTFAVRATVSEAGRHGLEERGIGLACCCIGA